MARRAVLWGPVVLFMVAIWVLAGETDVRQTVRIWDKAAHALAWALFGLLCLRATHGGLRSLRRPRAVPAAGAALLALAYGALDEWHQASIPGRDASLQDVLADAVGVGLALALVGLGALAAGRPAGDELDDSSKRRKV